MPTNDLELVKALCSPTLAACEAEREAAGAVVALDGDVGYSADAPALAPWVQEMLDD